MASSATSPPESAQQINTTSTTTRRLLALSRTMSTTAQTPASIGAAPWRPAFLTHLSKLESPEFVLSTMAPSTDPSSPVPFEPRARYCVFRGMFGEVPANKHYEGPKNEHVYESDMLTFTTDVRMAKIPELFATGPGKGDVDQSQGSGGGGKVEAVFWVKDVMTQWRIKGNAFVIAPDIEGEGEESSGVRTVKSQVGSRLRVVREDGKDVWSWATELTAQFANLSPGMRGSFKNPIPGSPVGIPPADKRLGLGQKVTDNEDEVARTNFRVVVIRPDVVEQVDLTDPNRARRWKYTYIGSSGSGAEQSDKVAGEWKIEELWP